MNAKLAFYAKEKRNDTMYTSKKIKAQVVKKVDGLIMVYVFDGKEVLTELTRDVVEQLVVAIYVHDDKRVEILFKFEDEMMKLLNMTHIDTK